MLGKLKTAGSKAIFLDRDGTLNRDVEYLIDFEDFEAIPGTETALRLLQNLGYRLFVVSNQSGVARGYFPLEAVEDLNRKIRDHFGALGIRIEEMVFCPHHPEGSDPRYTRDCDCRKPRPGMIRYLGKKYDLDLKASYMVGDKLIDAQTGLNAGAAGVWLRPLPGSSREPGTQVDNGTNIKEFVSLLDFAESLREID